MWENQSHDFTYVLVHKMMVKDGDEKEKRNSTCMRMIFVQVVMGNKIKTAKGRKMDRMCL